MCVLAQGAEFASLCGLGDPISCASDRLRRVGQEFAEFSRAHAGGKLTEFLNGFFCRALLRQALARRRECVPECDDAPGLRAAVRALEAQVVCASEEVTYQSQQDDSRDRLLDPGCEAGSLKR